MYTDDTGNTDGETCERAWSYLGGYHSIVKEMRSSTRNEVLEDAMHFHFKRSERNCITLSERRQDAYSVMCYRQKFFEDEEDNGKSMAQKFIECNPDATPRAFQFKCLSRMDNNIYGLASNINFLHSIK